METIFIDGLRIYPRRPNSPDYVLGSLVAEVDTLTKFLKDKADDKGVVRIDILRAKSGRSYLKLNTWKPTQAKNETPIEQATSLDDIPF